MRQRLVLVLLLVIVLMTLGEVALSDSWHGELLAEAAETIGLDWLAPILQFAVPLAIVGLPLGIIYCLQRRGYLAPAYPSGTPAQQRNAAGISLFDRGAYQAAVVEFTEALRLDPHLGEANYNRANAYLSLEQLDLAAADFEAALPLMKDRSKVHSSYAYLWAKRGDLERAFAECEKALQLDPSNSAALASRGNLLHARGELDRAAADFDRALFYSPKLGNAYTGRSLVRTAQGRWDEALADLEQALVFGNDAHDLVLRARIWLEKKDYDRALADLNAAIDAGCDEADAFRDRGLAWIFKGNFEKAIADSNLAIARDATDAISFNNRGTAYLRAGVYEKALADLKQAQQLDPKLPNVYKNLAWLQATCPQAEFRDGAQAVANATRALEMIEWKAAEWLPILAAAHAEASEFDEAVRRQTEYLSKAQQWSKADAQAALELYRAGKPYRDERQLPS